MSLTKVCWLGGGKPRPARLIASETAARTTALFKSAHFVTAASGWRGPGLTGSKPSVTPPTFLAICDRLLSTIGSQGSAPAPYVFFPKHVITHRSCTPWGRSAWTGTVSPVTLSSQQHRTPVDEDPHVSAPTLTPVVPPALHGLGSREDTLQSKQEGSVSGGDTG